jgi:hypothetical protein
LASNKQIFDDIGKAAERALDKLSKPSNLRKHGQSLGSQIQKRTRLGKGVASENGTLSRLKKLKPDYIKQRKKGKLSSKTTPARSNLTRTGQLLKSIKGGAKTFGKIIVEFFGDRNDGKTNDDIAGWQEKQGRPFFYMSKPERNKLTGELRKDIEQRIDQELKKL